MKKLEELIGGRGPIEDGRAQLSAFDNELAIGSATECVRELLPAVGSLRALVCVL